MTASVAPGRNDTLVRYALAGALAPLAVADYIYDTLSAQEHGGLPTAAEFAAAVEPPGTTGRHRAGTSRASRLTSGHGDHPRTGRTGTPHLPAREFQEGRYGVPEEVPLGSPHGGRPYRPLRGDQGEREVDGGREPSALARCA